jgi:hypothetical protein
MLSTIGSQLELKITKLHWSQNAICGDEIPSPETQQRCEPNEKPLSVPQA